MAYIKQREIKILQEVSERISRSHLEESTSLKRDTIEDVKLYLCQDTKNMIDEVLKRIK